MSEDARERTRIFYQKLNYLRSGLEFRASLGLFERSFLLFFVVLIAKSEIWSVRELQRRVRRVMVSFFISSSTSSIYTRNGFVPILW